MSKYGRKMSRRLFIENNKTPEYNTTDNKEVSAFGRSENNEALIHGKAENIGTPAYGVMETSDAQPHGMQQPRAPGEKLMNETSAKKFYREKLRHGKAVTEPTVKEKKVMRKKQLQGRQAIARQMEERAAFHKAINDANEDQNVGTEAVNDTTAVVGEANDLVRYYKYSAKLRGENAGGGKFKGHGVKLGKNAKEANLKAGVTEKAGSAAKAVKKAYMKKTIRKNAEKMTKSGIAKKIASKVAELSAKFAQLLLKAAASHPEVVLTIMLILIVVMIIASASSSVGILMSSLGHSTVETSFSAEDSDILAVEADYDAKEQELREKIANIESEHPGYDEYRYETDEIGHNPFELAAILTVLYEAYTEDEVQDCLDEIFELQYKLTTESKTERRTRRERRSRTVTNPDGSTSTEYYYVDVEYDYHILIVKLTNSGLASVARKLGFTDDEMARFRLLVETKGNKPYLFADDPYVSPDPGADDDYEIPPEALTDTKFANMIREAEKHLGLPYVWGGYSPVTGFDCSGFVSWVINHCGNGWNVGRQTANGLLGCCTRVSTDEAKPGDLIFFKGTYATNGASHVGIYVGNGMMIHCGSPIQYTSINTRYWKKHFYTFGRLND